jgi:hypothetical protein
VVVRPGKLWKYYIVYIDYIFAYVKPYYVV